MRVIAGKARGINLVAPQGRHTRPTADRIKETLFNIIQADVSESRFRDLFSGSGGIAIEALSRGAKEAVFVDNNREAVLCIKENIKKAGFTAISQVMQAEAIQAIKRLSNTGKVFDIIFMDPPYNYGIEKAVIEFLFKSPVIQEDTLIIAETSIQTDISYIESFPGRLEKVKEYKTNKHIFLRV